MPAVCRANLAQSGRRPGKPAMPPLPRNHTGRHCSRLRLAPSL